MGRHHSVLSSTDPIRGQILRENMPNLRKSMILNPNLPGVSADPGFAEMETKPSNGSSSNFIKIASNRIVFASPNVGSSVSETEAKILTDSNSRKRKTVSKGKLQKPVDEQNNQDPKQCKTSENKRVENDSTNKEEKDENHKNQDDANTKPSEPPKDYIHVRARRGQATDSHSLAERVRREKISERMKLLQDLVPGCNKVTGKALMLDEIINYVQSLQRQVEFLSMKLASVNTVDFNTDSLLFKDINSSAYAVDSTSLFGKRKQKILNSKTDGPTTHCSLDPSDTAMCKDISIHSPLVDEFGQGFPQFSESYRDDLQSIVMTGFGRNPSAKSGLLLQTFADSSDTTTHNMSIEL